MNQKHARRASALRGCHLGDIYYVLFRRKWLILVFAVCGFIAAGVTSVLWHSSYTSSAELYIGHITDTKDPVQDPTAVNIRSGAEQGSGILATEIEILENFDNARLTAEFVGADKILAPYSGGTNVDAAARVIKSRIFRPWCPSPARPSA